VQGEDRKVFSYIGETKDGRPCYVSGFDESVDMDERIKVFKERIATIFNLGAVELKTDVKKIRILGDRFTAQKNIYGDLNNTPKEQAAKISSLYDLADILATSTYDPTATGTEPSYANPTIKPKNKAHENVKYWYKFRNEIVFDGVPYTVTFNIRDKGKEQYQYLIDFNENKTPGLSNTAVKGLLRADRMSYEDSITQPEDSVNTSAENSSENSSDNLYSVDETAENADVSENRDLTDREMLLAIAEQLVGSEAEYKTVADYKAEYDTIREKQDRIDELTSRQRDLQSIMFTGEDAKARSDAAKELRSIHEEMNTLLEDVADADRKLTEIEGMKAIRNLIQRERLAVRDTYRTKYKTMYERKTEAKATTEARRSVRRLYNRVNRLLFSPTKTRNVPIGMQSIVAGALQAANVDAEAIERLGQLEEQLAKLEQEPVQDLEKMADLEQRIEAQEQKVGKIKDQVSMLIEIFEATNDTNADGETRLVFDETVLQKLKDLRTEIGNASIRNMDRKQLQALKDFYDMIWHRIKVANNTLASNRKLEINKVGEQSSREVRDSKALKILSPKSMELVGAQTARKYIWSQLKPLTAFEVLGSDTFMSLFREVLNGEDVWARQ